MKNHWGSLLGAAALVLLVSGCAATAQPVIPTYTDPTQTITVKNGEQFVIQTTYDPASGYSWYEDYDAKKLQLLESTCVFCRTGESEFIRRQGFGLYGGQPPMAAQFVRFRALGAGEALVTLSYRTGPDSMAVKQITFSVVVQP